MRKLAFFLVMTALARGAGFAATAPRGTVARGQVRSTAATAAKPAPAVAPMSASTPVPTPVSAPPKANAARAASSSKVVFAGGGSTAKIAVSNANNDVEGNPCKEEYWRCMDMFCMSDIENGGRCACSNDTIKLDKEYKKTVAEIDAELGKLSAIETEIEYGGEVSGRRDAQKDAGAEDVECDGDDDIACKVGAARYNAAAKMCETEVSDECKSSFAFTKLQYTQNIRSDCAAYQGAIKNIKEKGAAATYKARKDMRELAAGQFDAKNKFNESDCRQELKKCMAGPDACGADWTRCVGGVGEKRFHCESVLDNCAAVRESVWEGFAAEIAPEIKSADLTAESDARQSCLTRLSDCVANACRDNIEGLGETMDGCLTHPEMARSFCKVELDECDENGNMWPFVKQKLAAMSSDRCKEEVMGCVTGENACGKDFGNCIGMDAEAIYRMCPVEKLVVCRGGKPDFAMADLGEAIGGIMISLDDKLREKCQGIADDKMIEVCGDLENCDQAFEKDNKKRFSGAVNFAAVGYSDGTEWSACKKKDPDGKCAKHPKAGTLLTEEYVGNAMQNPGADEAALRAELRTAAARINVVIGELEGDARVSWCVEGRGLGQIAGEGSAAARYPDMLRGYRGIITAAGLKKFSEE
ncbi:MAG: hypothetical protein LBL21_04860 [Rickettsiales bacterium]|jgi:hypothetical protein|nr:hypothetical protein [Rickettsiales bacterium]